MGGGMAFKPNKHLESWLDYRENMQKYFRFTPKTTTICVIFGIVVPVFMYNQIVDYMHRDSVKRGRPRQEFLGRKGDY